MKSITITEIKYVEDYTLELTFSDHCIKSFDFSVLIDFNGMAEPLKDKDFFKNIMILQDGRAFGWANNYDCCADWLRYYAKDAENEWDGFEDEISLKQRILIAEQKLKLNNIYS